MLYNNKHCNTCRKTLPIGLFYKRSDASGYRGDCRECCCNKDKERTVKKLLSYPKKLCECDCGIEISKSDTSGYERQFAYGHGSKGKNNPMY